MSGTRVPYVILSSGINMMLLFRNSKVRTLMGLLCAPYSLIVLLLGIASVIGASSYAAPEPALKVFMILLGASALFTQLVIWSFILSGYIFLSKRSRALRLLLTLPLFVGCFTSFVPVFYGDYSDSMAVLVINLLFVVGATPPLLLWLFSILSPSWIQQQLPDTAEPSYTPSSQRILKFNIPIWLKLIGIVVFILAFLGMCMLKVTPTSG